MKPRGVELHQAEVASQLLASALSHELTNQMQPLMTLLRFAGSARPEELGPFLQVAREAVGYCLELSQQLRPLGREPAPRERFPVGEAVEAARAALPPELGGRVRASPGPGPLVEAERAALVAALGQLLRYAEQVAEPTSPVELALGQPGGPVVRVCFGAPSPARDDAPALPLGGAGREQLRLTPALALAYAWTGRALSYDALRVSVGEQSGRLELWPGPAEGGGAGG